jgi:hypothetical protein
LHGHVSGRRFDLPRLQHASARTISSLSHKDNIHEAALYTQPYNQVWSADVV